MHRKLVLAIVALIGLGSLAALGSSPEFIRTLVDAVKKGSIASVFTAPADAGPDAANIRTGFPNQTAEAPEVTEKVLWRIVFTVADRIVAEGRKADAQTGEASLYNNYFTRQGKLSAESDAVLKDLAARYNSEIEPLDKRAGVLIEKARAKFTDAKARRKSVPPAELGELQRQRDEITLRYRDEFRNIVGEDAYGDFSVFLKNDFLSGAKSMPYPGEGDQLTPQAFLLFTIIIWDDGLPIPLITGIGGTVVDFFDGFYYDPWVGSELYNWSTNQSLHVGTNQGHRWLYPALVFHPVYPTTRGLWYCNYTIHYAIDRVIFFRNQNEDVPSRLLPDLQPLGGGNLTAPESAYYLGELQVCHQVQQQCQGLTGAACQTPTPTPTPSPTPIEIKTVGFKQDYQIHKFPSGVAITDPTWTRGSGTNGQNYVAYKKDVTDAKLDASFDVNPAPPAGDSIQVKVRATYNGQVVAETTDNTTVTTSSFSVTNVPIDRTKLEATPQVKKGMYTFTWEVTVDNGQTWRAAGSSDHTLYWLYAKPVAPIDTNPNQCLTDGIPRNCLFVNGFGIVGPTGNGNEYAGLFDKALEIAIDDLDPSTQSADAIAKKLAYKIDENIKYDPGDDQADFQHPLFIWTGTARKAQCSANANLLLGLLRSIGINGDTYYFWGGKPTNAEFGGKVHAYNYREKLSPTTYRELTLTMKTKRPAKLTGGENIPLDPHFTFHSMVKAENKYFDPSYGKDIFFQPNYPFSDITIDEALSFKNDNLAKPKFKTGSKTAPFVVRAFNMQTFCSPRADNNFCASNTETVWSQKFCKHSFKLPRVSQPGMITHFDADDFSDFAVWRPSNGTWYITNSADQSQSYIGFGQNGDKPAPGDYDGDGRTDPAVFRPSNGTWYINRSSDAGYTAVQFGLSGDKPLFADFDGDGRSDIAVFRPSDGNWYWINSSDGSIHIVHWGSNGDVPVSGDYDGDGKTDFAVYRPSDGNWYILTSVTFNYTIQAFGLSDDIPVTGDFDGDGKSDIAVFRPSTAVWYISQSTDGYTGFQFGSVGDVPSTGEYNEDDGVDPAVWSPSTGRWRVLNLEDASIVELYWGMSGDVAVPASFNR